MLLSYSKEGRKEIGIQSRRIVKVVKSHSTGYSLNLANRNLKSDVCSPLNIRNSCVSVLHCKHHLTVVYCHNNRLGKFDLILNPFKYFFFS